MHPRTGKIPDDVRSRLSASRCGSETESCAVLITAWELSGWITLQKKNMKTQGNEASHLPLLIGGVAVILLGTTGIAAVMAWTPTSTDVAGVVFEQAQISPARAEGDARVRARMKCAECGVVASTREIEQPGAGIDPGASGGVTRSSRNAIHGKSTKSYEVTARMKDGSSRVFMDANPANWRPGERVIFIEGVNQSND